MSFQKYGDWTIFQSPIANNIEGNKLYSRFLNDVDNSGYNEDY